MNEAEIELSAFLRIGQLLTLVVILFLQDFEGYSLCLQKKKKSTNTNQGSNSNLHAIII